MPAPGPASLEAAYLASTDPYHRSGFRGSARRWRDERGPILDAIDHSGHLLDIGCANGLLLESLGSWAAERGIKLTPHGIDIGPRLIADARQRLPAFAHNLHCADIWHWSPPPAHEYDYIYTVYDIPARPRLPEYITHLRTLFPRGRLIIGAYATQQAPAPTRAELRPLLPPALPITGGSATGEHGRTTVVWSDPT